MSRDIGYKDARKLVQKVEPTVQTLFKSAIERREDEDDSPSEGFVVLEYDKKFDVIIRGYAYTLCLVRDDFIRTHPQYVHQGRVIPLESGFGICTYYMQAAADEAAYKHRQDLRQMENFCRDVGRRMPERVEDDGHIYHLGMASKYSLELFKRDYGYYYVIPLNKDYINKN